jgi:hypothetical protein
MAIIKAYVLGIKKVLLNIENKTYFGLAVGNGNNYKFQFFL